MAAPNPHDPGHYYHFPNRVTRVFCPWDDVSPYPTARTIFHTIPGLSNPETFKSATYVTATYVTGGVLPSALAARPGSHSQTWQPCRSAERAKSSAVARGSWAAR